MYGYMHRNWIVWGIATVETPFYTSSSLVMFRFCESVGANTSKAFAETSRVAPREDTHIGSKIIPMYYQWANLDHRPVTLIVGTNPILVG